MKSNQNEPESKERGLDRGALIFVWAFTGALLASLLFQSPQTAKAPEAPVAKTVVAAPSPLALPEQPSERPGRDRPDSRERAYRDFDSGRLPDISGPATPDVGAPPAAPAASAPVSSAAPATSTASKTSTAPKASSASPSSAPALKAPNASPAPASSAKPAAALLAAPVADPVLSSDRSRPDRPDGRPSRDEAEPFLN